MGTCMEPRVRKISRKFLLTVFLGIVLQSPAEAAADRTLYAENLDSGWQNWSWDTTVNTAANLPVHTGSHSMSVKYTAA